MEDTTQSAREYLFEHNVLCLATSSQNRPWVAPVFYTVYLDRLVFLSAPHTLHCRNIAANPIVSASVQEDYKDWAEIKGIQLQGTVKRVSEVETPAVIEVYSRKFPVTGLGAPAEIANALEKIQWFEISVEQLLFIDNSRGLGHRVELDTGRVFSN